jgi:hypothetical protein
LNPEYVLIVSEYVLIICLDVSYNHRFCCGVEILAHVHYVNGDLKYAFIGSLPWINGDMTSCDFTIKKCVSSPSINDTR